MWNHEEWNAHGLSVQERFLLMTAERIGTYETQKRMSIITGMSIRSVARAKKRLRELELWQELERKEQEEEKKKRQERLRILHELCNQS